MLRTLLPRYGRLQERSLIWAVLAESSNPYLAPGEINQFTFASVSQQGRRVFRDTQAARNLSLKLRLCNSSELAQAVPFPD